MRTGLPLGPMPDTSVATSDGTHRTQIINSYVFWVECSCGWKSSSRGSHTNALADAQAHRATYEIAA